MSICEFRSCLNLHMEKFIAIRRVLGMDYRSQAERLRSFDNFLCKENFSAPFLNPDIIDRYLGSILHLQPCTQRNRFSTVRQFCCYLSQLEPLCYVPESRDLKGIASTSYTPFIFTRSQIASLLVEASNLSPQYPLRPHTYKMLFGLLYTTGIRSREALSLDIKDVYLDSNRLHIRKGKFYKERWVPIVNSTGLKLKEYLDLRRGSPWLPLFINSKSRRLKYDGVFDTFHYLRKRCDIRPTKGSKPTIYSFRHTFAVHRLLEWYQDGKDINARLPALATYMGHVDINSTQVYLHATAELLEQTSQRFLTYFRQNIVNIGGNHE